MARLGGFRRFRDRDVAWIALAVFVLAFAVRLVWILRVQSPHGAVYSDMGGYVARAEELLGWRQGGDPRFGAFYPWGTHVFVALEFAVFGRTSVAGIAITQAFVGAIPVPCVAFLSARFAQGRRASRLLAGAAGLVAALWHPQITYAAYFMSEIWFTAALLLCAWLFVRHTENRSGTLGAGCALAAAYVIRPQVLLTMILLSAVVVLGIGGRAVRPRSRWALLLAPFAVLAIASSIRLHELSGRLGFISENDSVQRLFADTDVGRIESTWVTKSGQRTGAWFSPGTKHPLTPERIATFDGYIADPVILGRIRKERLRGVPLLARAARLVDNVKLLVWKNLPNPEADFHADRTRFKLQRVYRDFTLWLLAFGALGIREMVVRHRMAGLVVLANLFTVVFVAAFYFGEARYRVPYDPFLVIAAGAGASFLVRSVRRLAKRSRPGEQRTGHGLAQVAQDTVATTMRSATSERGAGSA